MVQKNNRINNTVGLEFFTEFLIKLARKSMQSF